MTSSISLQIPPRYHSSTITTKEPLPPPHGQTTPVPPPERRGVGFLCFRALYLFWGILLYFYSARDGYEVRKDATRGGIYFDETSLREREGNDLRGYESVAEARCFPLFPRTKSVWRWQTAGATVHPLK